MSERRDIVNGICVHFETRGERRAAEAEIRHLGEGPYARHAP